MVIIIIINLFFLLISKYVEYYLYYLAACKVHILVSKKLMWISSTSCREKYNLRMFLHFRLNKHCCYESVRLIKIWKMSSLYVIIKNNESSSLICEHNKLDLMNNLKNTNKIAIQL